MAPKKQQQEAAAAAAADTNNEAATKPTEEQQQQEEEDNNTPKMPSPLLDKPTLVILEDDRQILGHLIAFDANGSVLLQNAIERKKINDGLITQRSTLSLCVPANRLKAIYQRESNAPEYEEIEKRNADYMKGLQERQEKKQKKIEQ